MPRLIEHGWRTKGALLIGTMCLGVVLSADNARPQSRGFAIAGIAAKLFYSNSGRFSANILGNPKIVLHNIPIGEGAGVEGPSENTLLIVQVQGPPKGGLEGLQLRVTATTEDDTLADREIEIGTMNTAGNYYAACWLDDTGCKAVTVTAQLTHGKERKQVRALIPFECSE